MSRQHGEGWIEALAGCPGCQAVSQGQPCSLKYRYCAIRWGYEHFADVHSVLTVFIEERDRAEEEAQIDDLGPSVEAELSREVQRLFSLSPAALSRAERMKRREDIARRTTKA